MSRASRPVVVFAVIEIHPKRGDTDSAGGGSEAIERGAGTMFKDHRDNPRVVRVSGMWEGQNLAPAGGRAYFWNHTHYLISHLHLNPDL